MSCFSSPSEKNDKIPHDESRWAGGIVKARNNLEQQFMLWFSQLENIREW